VSIYTRHWKVSLAHAWLWRSQESSPMYDAAKANRILRDHKSVVERELWRMGVDIDPKPIEGKDDETKDDVQHAGSEEILSAG